MIQIPSGIFFTIASADVTSNIVRTKMYHLNKDNRFSCIKRKLSAKTLAAFIWDIEHPPKYIPLIKIMVQNRSLVYKKFEQIKPAFQHNNCH